MPTYNQPNNFLIMYYVKSTNALGQVLPLEVYDLVRRQPPMPEATAAPAMSKDEITKQINDAVKETLKRYFPQINFSD